MSPLPRQSSARFSTSRPSLLGVSMAGFIAVASLWLAGCGPSYPNCDGDDTCKPKGEYCLEKKCVQCRLTAHCANAGTDVCVACQAGQCIRKPGCCANNLDCASGKKCNANRCVNQCASDSDCTGGKICSESGACISPDSSGCATDKDCGGNLKCDGGRCVNDSGECQLVAVHFDFNRANLGRGAQNTVSANARCLKERKIKSITVEGHCDERGTDAYNLELGNRRARAVKRYLKSVSRRTKVRTVSYGKARPTCTDASERCWSENRRAEFKAR